MVSCIIIVLFQIHVHFAFKPNISLRFCNEPVFCIVEWIYLDDLFAVPLNLQWFVRSPVPQGTRTLRFICRASEELPLLFEFATTSVVVSW